MAAAEPPTRANLRIRLIWKPPGRVYPSRDEDASKGQLGCRAERLDFLLFTLEQEEHGLVRRDENRSQKPGRAAVLLPLLDRRLNSPDDGNQLLLADAWPVALEQVGG